MRYVRLLLVSLFLALAVFLVEAPGSQGDPPPSFTVDGYTDAADEDPGDGECDDGAGNCTLRAAIQEANALADDYTINVPAGTYELSQTLWSLVVSSNLDIDGEGPGAGTIIDGNDDDRVFQILSTATVQISNVEITNGSALIFGGGIYNSGDLTLIDSVVRRNTVCAEGWGEGGAIYNDHGTVELRDSTVSDNEAAWGGALTNNGGTVTLINATVSGNHATLSASAIHNEHGGDLTLINSTVSGNTAEYLSGAIENTTPWEGKQPVVELINVTVAHNGDLEHDGRGISNASEGPFKLKNTIVANNPGGDCSGTITSDGHNLDSDDSCDLDEEEKHDLPGRNPLLGELANNGGPTETHALLVEGDPPTYSPAIDAGDNSACPATDQRGFARPVDGDENGSLVCDIGAFERLCTVDHDMDCDGWTTDEENYLGTDPNQRCAETPDIDDEDPPDAWPLDFNDDQWANMDDVNKFAPHLNQPATGERKRFDLNRDDFVSMLDIIFGYVTKLAPETIPESCVPD